MKNQGWNKITIEKILYNYLLGYPSHVFDGRPVIGICNSWSELTPWYGSLFFRKRVLMKSIFKF